jgi:hypothetical protein
MADFNTDLTVKQTQQMSLADLLNVAKGGLEYQKAKELYQPSIEGAKAEAASKIIGAEKARRTLEPEVSVAETTAQEKKLDFKNKQAQIVFDEINSLAANPLIKNFEPKNAKAAAEAISKAKKRAADRGADPTEIDLMAAPLFNQILQGKGETIHQTLLDSINTAKNSGQFGQATSVTPVSTGQRTEFVQTSPFTKNKTTTSVQGEVPITQKIVDPQTGEERIVGVQPRNAKVPLNTNVAPFTQAQIETAGKEYAANQNEYKQANTTIGTLKNIKGLAPGAFTGVGSEYKRLASGILTSLGIDINSIEQSKTEEIAKNAALLTLAGGNTDLARQIAESATPNSKMSERTIKNITNQLIGIQRMKQGRLEYAAPYINNPKEYQKHLNMFDKFADYRIFQLGDMTPAERKEYKSSLSKDERDSITKLIKEAEAVGIDIPGVK